MYLLFGSPEISVHMISAHDRYLESCCGHTQVTELFCCHRLVTGDKLWIYRLNTLNKLEFMQWKDVDWPTFTSMGNSAINWLHYGNSFFWDTDGLLMTDYLHPGKTTTGQY